MECVLPESCQLTHTKQVQRPFLVSVCVYLCVCIREAQLVSLAVETYSM